MDKELVLIVNHSNWGMMGPGAWENTEWKIYDDQTVDIEISYHLESEKNKTMNAKLTKDNYDNLFKQIELIKENDIKVYAFDGSAWEIIQYAHDNEIWKREKGYIYGVKPLEEISVILKNLISD